MTDLPDALSQLAGEPVWVAWDASRGRKVPKSPYGGNAKSNDPVTWGTYAEAQAAADRGGFSGVGVMLSGGLVGIDMDGVVGEGGDIEPWAQKVVDEIGSYAEISPSGTGVHVIARADPGVVGAIGRANHAKGLEVYNHGRYFTVTGRQIAGKGIADATEGVAKLLADEFPSESGEDRLRKAVGRMARDQVGRRANRAVAHNAERDGVRYARVPQGGETCEFCAMLASRGFVYTSTKTAGELKHYHVGCRCKVVPEPKGGLDVEGYDPDEWYSRWREMEEVDNDVSLSIKQKLAAKARINGEARSSGVDIAIDELTPCLRRVSDGAILQTSFETIKPKKGEFKDWEFDWSRPAKEGCTVEALHVDGDERVQGLLAFKDDKANYAVHIDIVESAPFNSPHNRRNGGRKDYSGVGAHLFAEAVKRSYELGYNGFVIFEAKTNLIDYYSKELGASQIGSSQRMYIDEMAARELYERYYGNKS